MFDDLSGDVTCMEEYLLYEIPCIIDPEIAKLLITGGATVFGGLFVYANFVMKWATDRMKDWEAAKERTGAPALVCWIAGVGELAACLVGAHFFAGLYILLNGKVYYWHGLMLIGFAVTIIWLWGILIVWLRWYFRHRGQLSPLTETMSQEPIHWHRPLQWTVALFVVTGIGSLIECFLGDFTAGLMGLFYELIGAFGIGAYCSIRGDLLLRAIVPPIASTTTTAPPERIAAVNRLPVGQSYGSGILTASPGSDQTFPARGA